MKKRAVEETNHTPWIIAILVLIFFCTIIYLGTTMAEMGIRNSKDFEMKSMKLSSTHRGEFSLSEINHQVYKKFGYEITEPALPLPIVTIKNNPKCGKVFADWLKIAESPSVERPNEKLPVLLEREFTLNSYAKLRFSSQEETTPADQVSSGWSDLKDLMTWKLSEVAELEHKTGGMSVHHAMQVYPLTGKRGLIIGSRKPWLEVFALQHGAEHLTTVEEHNLNIPVEFQKKIDHLAPMALAYNWEQYAESFDFAVSFSTIQRSGLGEKMDPIADIREMLKIKCLLKPGGVLFFGATLGEDELIFKQSRVYGPVRLAMLLDGFELVAGFNGENPTPIDLTDKKQLFSNNYNTLVLRKL